MQPDARHQRGAGTMPAKTNDAERRLRCMPRSDGLGDVVWSYHSGLPSFSVNEENMMLKLTLILSSSLMLVSTECSR